MPDTPNTADPRPANPPAAKPAPARPLPTMSQLTGTVVPAKEAAEPVKEEPTTEAPEKDTKKKPKSRRAIILGLIALAGAATVAMCSHADSAPTQAEFKDAVADHFAEFGAGSSIDSKTGKHHKGDEAVKRYDAILTVNSLICKKVPQAEDDDWDCAIDVSYKTTMKPQLSGRVKGHDILRHYSNGNWFPKDRSYHAPYPYMEMGKGTGHYMQIPRPARPAEAPSAVPDTTQPA